MNNIMLDLETYGNTPGSMILSIGACAFDEYTGKIDEGFYTVVLDGGKAFGLHRDEGTVDWWKKQSENARQVLKDCRWPDAPPLPKALDLLDAYVRRFGGKDALVWGCGSDFDNALIRAAYRAVDVNREPVWAFWNNRCYRTLKSLFGAGAINRRGGTHHNALDDAKAQAEHCYRLLKATRK